MLNARTEFNRASVSWYITTRQPPAATMPMVTSQYNGLFAQSGAPRCSCSRMRYQRSSSTAAPPASPHTQSGISTLLTGERQDAVHDLAKLRRSVSQRVGDPPGRQARVPRESLTDCSLMPAKQALHLLPGQAGFPRDAVHGPEVPVGIRKRRLYSRPVVPMLCHVDHVGRLKHTVAHDGIVVHVRNPNARYASCRLSSAVRRRSRTSAARAPISAFRRAIGPARSSVTTRKCFPAWRTRCSAPPPSVSPSA